MFIWYKSLGLGENICNVLFFHSNLHSKFFSICFDTSSRSNEFKCTNNPQCLRSEYVCDGIKDCEDGSDETLLMCIVSICPKNTFRCKYGGCLPIDRACDNSIDCVDASDEIPSICTALNPNYSYKTITSTKPSGKATSVRNGQKHPPEPLLAKGCTIAETLQNLRVKTLFNVLPYQKGAEIPSTVVVRLTCDNNTVFIGSDLNQCLDGKWQETWPECRPTCSRTKFANDLSTQATCDYNGQIRKCSDMDMQLLPKTMATITCSPGYKSNVERSKEIAICRKDGEIATWNSQRLLKCIPHCGKIPNTVKHEPWLVSVFESYNEKNQFKLKCFGKIISPWLIFIPSFNCLVMENVEQVVVAEGHQRNDFDRDQEYAYHLHNIKSIYKR